MKNNYKILIAAGGTGGHVYPAVAIADALKEKKKQAEIIFVGTRDRMEWTEVPRAGYDIYPVWISGFHRRLTLKNLLFPVKVPVSLLQSYLIIKKINPDVVICCGGFASGPIGWMAGRMKIPLVLQEQNSFPGLTTRRLAGKATKIFIAFKDAAAWFNPEKTELVGNPTRKKLVVAERSSALEFFGLTEKHRKTLLLLGGSGGAKTVNEAVMQNLDLLHNDLGLQIIWQCGERYYDDLRSKIDLKDYSRLRLFAFLNDMPQAYAASDLVISRAGALSCAELMITGKPSILIPSPYVAGNHQAKNAHSMMQSGASEIVKDKEAAQKLYEVVGRIISDKQKLEKMSEAAASLAKPDAANVIAESVIQIADQHRCRKK